MQSDDEPPAEKRGSVIPILGKILNSMPILTNICAKSITDMPLHIKYPTLSLALRPVVITLIISTAKIMITASAPIYQSSSPATVKIISLSLTGTEPL